MYFSLFVDMHVYFWNISTLNTNSITKYCCQCGSIWNFSQSSITQLASYEWFNTIASLMNAQNPFYERGLQIRCGETETCCIIEF